MPTACAAPAAFTPDDVARCCLCWGKYYPEIIYCFLVGRGKGSVLNNPGELIFCDILLNQVEEIQSSQEKTARLLLHFLLAGS